MKPTALRLVLSRETIVSPTVCDPEITCCPPFVCPTERTSHAIVCGSY